MIKGSGKTKSPNLRQGQRTGMRCSFCNAQDHIKPVCDKVKCFFCREYGHTSNACLRYMAFLVIRDYK